MSLSPQAKSVSKLDALDSSPEMRAAWTEFLTKKLETSDGTIVIRDPLTKEIVAICVSVDNETNFKTG